MEKMEIIQKLHIAEEKKQDLKYIIANAKSTYLEEVNIETNFVTKDWDFDGNRMIKVSPKLFIQYLNAELEEVTRYYQSLVNMLVEAN